MIQVEEQIWQGLSASLWTSGTLILAVQFMSFLNAKWVEHRRIYMLRLSRGMTPEPFSIYRYSLFKGFKEAVDIAGIRVSPTILLGLSAALLIFSYLSADSIIGYLKVRYALDADRAIDPETPCLNIVFALLMASLPLFYVMFRLQRKRQDMALGMIGVVQNLIGSYNPRMTLGDVISRSARTMPGVIRKEWGTLEMTIRTRGAKEALYRFAKRIGNDWAEDLADILLVKAEYGHDVSKSLHKLVRDMQTAKSNEQKRQATISVYRIGTAFMVFASFFVIGFNIKADSNNYRYYFLDPTGKKIMVVSLIVLFGSMFAVILSGRKRI